MVPSLHTFVHSGLRYLAHDATKWQYLHLAPAALVFSPRPEGLQLENQGIRHIHLFFSVCHLGFIMRHVREQRSQLAGSKLQLTEGYTCMHSRTISYKLYDVTVRINVDKTGTSFLTNLRGSRKSVLGVYWYQYSCYFCFVFLCVCVIRLAQLVFFNVLKYNAHGEVSRIIS